jgi:hypothetical protein
VRVAFEVANDNDTFLQYDFKRYLAVNLSNEDDSSFFTKTSDSTPVNVKDFLASSNFDVGLLDNDIFNPETL